MNNAAVFNQFTTSDYGLNSSASIGKLQNALEAEINSNQYMTQIEAGWEAGSDSSYFTIQPQTPWQSGVQSKVSYLTIAFATVAALNAMHSLNNQSYGQISAPSLISEDIRLKISEVNYLPTRRLTSEEHEVFQLTMLDCAEIVSYGQYIEL